MNYYNEFDSHCAAWLQNLMDAGHIPVGHIDTRSIEDVTPNDLRGYTQCHFFAGVAGWPLALALAGWPASRPVWTGSCPCQPFSAAGKGAGFADERHLWPAWQHLIAQCCPPVVFGEQVASKVVGSWLDLVQADLEGMGYAFGSIAFPAAGIGAPHIRDRTYWVADVCGPGLPQRVSDGRVQREALGAHARQAVDGGGDLGGLADADGGHASTERQQRGGEQRQQPQDGCFGGLVDHRHRDLQLARPGPTSGIWGNADWLRCTDGKWRPVSASPQPMVDGIPISLGLVRSSRIEEIEGEVNAWEMETGFGRSEALRDLWRSAHEAAPRVWPVGGIPGLHEAPFLLAFVRQLAEQGWGIQECLSVPRQEVPEGRVRVLWSEIGIARPPRELQLAGQPRREYPDALRVLSSILARHAHQAWEASHSAYAETCFPLGTGLHSRVIRLRAYGNAIVPAQAAEFIATYAEIRGMSLEVAA